MAFSRQIIVIFIALFLVACSNNDDEPSVDSSEQQLYEDAQRFLRSSNFNLAVRSLQLLESRYPFGRYAEQAQLEIIYAHYQNFEREAAVEAANRFIRLHPQHPSVDYAYYMRGLAAYDEDKGLLDNFLPTDFTKRDPGSARKSFTDFAQLLARFPNSPYAPDAKARMVHLRNLLARYEINVANYYFKRGAYQAAANRGRYVVENFQQTPAVADGLAVMVQAYLLLDLPDLADDSLSVLAANYPSHPSLDSDGSFRHSFSHRGANKSWLDWMTLGFFDKGAPTEFDNRPPRD
jgi:outer membrane protein assembly factor BamD